VDPEDLLPVGEVAGRSGVAVSALHYYEQLGLIASQRTSGIQRRYPRHMIRRVSLVVVAKRLGIPLSDVADVFATLPMVAVPSVRDWRRLSRRWHDQLEEKKLEIERLQRELTGCIGCGCLSTKACYLVNPDDALAREGAGPRRVAR